MEDQNRSKDGSMGLENDGAGVENVGLENAEPKLQK